jgi:hypothetical protein
MVWSQENRSPILKKLVGIVSGVGANQTAVLKIPPGATYTDLVIQCTIAGVGATRVQLETFLTSMRLTVSGVEMWTLTGKQLIAIIEFYNTGLIADTGILTIPFERLWMDTQLSQTTPNYGTLGESSFQLEITQSGGSTIDLMTVYGRIDPVQENLGGHIMMKRLTPNIGSVGKYIYPDLFKKPGCFLYALHIEVPVVANLTNIAYVADEVRLVDFAPAVLNQLYLTGTARRTIQNAKLFVHLDFCSRGFDSDAVPLTMGTQILELDFANAAPNQVNIIAEIGTTDPTQAGAVAGK